jgi:hypothetical protein
MHRLDTFTLSSSSSIRVVPVSIVDIAVLSSSANPSSFLLFTLVDCCDRLNWLFAIVLVGVDVDCISLIGTSCRLASFLAINIIRLFIVVVCCIIICLIVSLVFALSLANVLCFLVCLPSLTHSSS